MRYLILGGAGFLGSHVVRRCLQDPGAEITVLDSLEYPAGSLPANLASCWDRIQYVRGSICNARLLNEIVPGQDAVFNCAAQSSHTESLENPFRDAETNQEGCLKILEAMRHFNRSGVLVYPSTTSVIGQTKNSSVDENSPCQPRDIYTIHKRTAENYIHAYGRLYGIPYTILRLGNLYGPFGRPEPEYSFINHFIHKALLGQDLEIFGEGNQLRNVTYAGDAAEILYRASSLPQMRGQTFFATSPFYHSVRQIAEEILRVFDSGKIIQRAWPHERSQIEVSSVRYSSEKLWAVSRWTPSLSLREGLEKTFSILKAQTAV